MTTRGMNGIFEPNKFFSLTEYPLRPPVELMVFELESAPNHSQLIE